MFRKFGNFTTNTDINADPRKILKFVLTIIVVIFVALSVLSGFYTVNEQQEAVVTMFGQVVKVSSSGLYFKIPWIQQVKKVDMTTHGTGIGYSLDNGGQNITDDENGIMITSDFNLLNIDFYLEYKVSDPVAYLYHSDDPEDILKNIALSSIRSVVADYTVDEAMTTAKGQIQTEVRDDMLRELKENDIGLTVVNITVQDSEPPTTEIIQAFKSVETAKQGADTARNNALEYQNKKLPAAEADADKIIQEAKADKEARIAEAEGQVARFNETYEQYKKYPLITKKRMFYETMEDILPELKVVVTDGATQTMLPLDDFTGGKDSISISQTTENDTDDGEE
ncbi:MAG: FtsH protease activity modulator HflK [Lachnospiraceae bacterium]|nr:FtsH protease activity modulator HflK [Lachnospiraceae bacterium]